MEVRKTRKEEIEKVMEIYEIARTFMKDHGNATQWGNSYPERNIIENDVEQGVSYVIINEDRICGTFMFVIGEESCYKEKGPYGIIHRIAGDQSTAGIVKCAVDYASKWHDVIWMDTHKDNLPMQQALRKQGFVFQKEVVYEDCGERIAFCREKEKRQLFSGDYTENELRHLFEPAGGVFIAESPNVIERALAIGCEPLAFLMEAGEWKDPDRRERINRDFASVPVFVESKEDMQDVTGLPMTRGMLCAMRRPELKGVNEILSKATRVAVLENVVNPTNVGAIFRSAAALFMDGVLLTTGCSDPLYRRAIRVSMGTVFQVPWAFLPEKKGIQILKEAGFTTVALALTEDSVSLTDERLLECEKMAIVLGTEGDGLAGETIEACDYTVKIPMSHGVDSLNVAAASAVAFWELSKKQ